ncbi:MAG: sigma-70 family RNA polymerase sigma factor [Verrucomicrobiota bacterium]
MTLVREFAAHQSESAFETLVARHINLVHSAALRQVSDPHLAQEITQAVFLILARKAARLPDGTFLLGWLFKTTRYAASAELRAADRRRRREDEAHMQSLISQTPDEAAWQHIAPLLDEALANLNETDRRAVLLRFFEGQTLGEVGAALSLNEEAARKRVNRGVEKLRKFFTKRGVTQTAAAIGVALTAHSVQAAPVGLAAIISATTLKGAAVASTVTALVNGTIKTIAMTTLQKSLIAVAVIALAVAIFEARQISTLRTQAQSLQQKQEPLTEQNQQLTRERDQATGELASLREEINQLNTNNAELLKLRARVALAVADKSDAVESRAELDRLAKGPLVVVMQDDKSFVTLDPATNEFARSINKQNADQSKSRELEKIEQLKRKLNLSSEQETDIRGLVLGRLEDKRKPKSVSSLEELASLGNEDKRLEEQVRQILSQEQLREYDSFLQGELWAKARDEANREVMNLQSTLGLSAEEQDQVFTILFEQKMNSEGKPKRRSRQEYLDYKLQPLEKVLSASEREIYRKQLEKIYVGSR